MATLRGDSANPNEPAVVGASTAPDQGMGVYGKADRGSGVIGESAEWIGVYGESAGYEGVRGTSKNEHHAGVVGINEAGGAAVYGVGGTGVQGIGRRWVGVYGETQAALGAGASAVLGDGKGGGIGVKGHASGAGQAAVAAYQLAGNGPGVYAEGAPAGLFRGNVDVTGALTVAGVGFAALVAEVAALREQLRLLAAQAASRSAPSTSGSPWIDVTQVTGTRRLRVDGTGFRKGWPYLIRLVVGTIGNELPFRGTTTQTGALTHELPTEGVAIGTTLWISASTEGSLSGVWSNTVTRTAS